MGILSTYPPQLCGLATFAAALATALLGAGNQVDIVAIDERRAAGARDRRCVARLVNGDPSSLRDAAEALSQCDVAIVQHEYGIYGGADGAEVIELLERLRVPSVVTLHTVPLRPTAHQQSVLETVCELADRVVVMTDAAATRLRALYAVDDAKLVTIPHGALAVRADASPAHAPGRRLQLLTWGLLGPGKGIEHAIRALELLRDLEPAVRYTVAGVTHPKVLAADGDQYRQHLLRTAWECGVANAVTFDHAYRDPVALGRFVATSSVVVLPYDSEDQVTSGVLVDALAAGRPVVATAFPHAVEALASGAGLVVPHADPEALAAAVRSMVSQPGRLESMIAEARRIAPRFEWSAVAGSYEVLCDDVIRDRQALIPT